MPLKKILFFIIITQFSFFSCTTISNKAQNNAEFMAENAVFEVVVKKPAENKNIVYEKNVNFALLLKNEADDEYAPLGTAFAISSNEAVTAFHVLNLASKSMVYDNFYLRKSNSSGVEIYEIENITRASNEMDFIFFTIRDKTFDNYFKIENNYKKDEAVFSIGNADGKGIITRSGKIVGIEKEEISGKWKNIKTTAPASPGSSGGPLVNKAGHVIGIVSALKNNITSVVPFDVINSSPKDKLKYSITLDYGHILHTKQISRSFNTTINLPLNYKVIQNKISDLYSIEYKNAMEELFNKSNFENDFVLNTPPETLFPELEIIRDETQGFQSAEFDVKQYKTGDNTMVWGAEAGAFNVWRIIDNDVKNDKLSKNEVDTILKILRPSRTFNNINYRIISFGNPYYHYEYRDTLGRLWTENRFFIPFDDTVFVSWTLPLPDGFILITVFSPSALVDIFNYDAKIIISHLHAVYSGNFMQWEGFLSNKKSIPLFIKDFNFSYIDKTLSIDTPDISVHLASPTFNWLEDAQFFVSPSHQISPSQKEKIIYAPQKYILDSGADSYAVLYRYNKPNAKNAGQLKMWDALIAEDAPFDGRTISTDYAKRLSSAGCVVQSDTPNGDVIWTLFMQTAFRGLEYDARIAFNALKAGVRIKN